MDTFDEKKNDEVVGGHTFWVHIFCDSGGAGWKRPSAMSTRFNFLIASAPHILISHFQKSKLKLHSALKHNGFLLHNRKNNMTEKN